MAVDVKNKVRRSIALGIDMPVGYVATGVQQAQLSSGVASSAKLREGGARGRIVGIVEDRGDGGGVWTHINHEDREAVQQWLERVPDLFAVEGLHDTPQQGGEWSAHTVLLEAEMLRDLTRAHRRGQVFVLGDGFPWDVHVGCVPDRRDTAALAVLRSKHPDERVRFWTPERGWYEPDEPHWA